MPSLPTLPQPCAPHRAWVRACGQWALAVVVVVASAGAVAQVSASHEYLARMDVDADGRVSLDEYQAWMGYAFTQMDRNRDDRLTADELPGGRGREVSLAEHRQRLADAFHRQDSNRDGVLDARELSAPPQ